MNEEKKIFIRKSEVEGIQHFQPVEKILPIFEFNMEEYPIFRQGDPESQHEMEEIVTAERINGLIDLIKNLVEENNNLKKERDKKGVILGFIKNIFSKKENTLEYVDETNDVYKHLNRISFKPSCLDFEWGWKVDPVSDKNGLNGFLIYSVFKRPDTNTGVIGTGCGRGWYIEKNYTEKDILMTGWLAIRQIIEHELLESFCIDKARMFDPHKSLSSLAYPECMDRPEWLSKKNETN